MRKRHSSSSSCAPHPSKRICAMPSTSTSQCGSSNWLSSSSHAMQKMAHKMGLASRVSTSPALALQLQSQLSLSSHSTSSRAGLGSHTTVERTSPFTPPTSSSSIPAHQQYKRHREKHPVLRPDLEAQQNNDIDNPILSPSPSPSPSTAPFASPHANVSLQPNELTYLPDDPEDDTDRYIAALTAVSSPSPSASATSKTTTSFPILRPYHTHLILDLCALESDSSITQLISQSWQITCQQYLSQHLMTNHGLNEWNQQIWTYCDISYDVTVGDEMRLQNVLQMVIQRLHQMEWMDESLFLTSWLTDPDSPHLMGMIDAIHDDIVSRITPLHIPTWTGLQSFLTSYKHGGGKVCMVSPYARSITMAMLQAMNLEGLINSVVSAQTHQTIPCTGLFREACARLQCLPAECIAIVQQPLHVMECHACDLPTLIVPTTTSLFYPGRHTYLPQSHINVSCHQSLHDSHSYVDFFLHLLYPCSINSHHHHDTVFHHTASSPLQPGDACLAIYHVDHRLYPARVESVKDDENVIVVFDGYGNRETVTQDEIIQIVDT